MANKWQSAAAVVEDAIATIAAGQTESNEIDLVGTTICGLFMPTAFDGTTIKFKAAFAEGEPFLPVYDDGAELSITVGASQYVTAELTKLAGLRRVKIVAGATQTVTRTIKLAARPV